MRINSAEKRKFRIIIIVRVQNLASVDSAVPLTSTLEENSVHI